MLFDSNILIYYLNASLDPSAHDFFDAALTKAEGDISVITRIEILGWPGINASGIRKANELLNRFRHHGLNDDIVSRCIVIRQQHRVKIPDAIIAATALFLGQPIVTRNRDDFKKIKGLRLIDIDTI